MVKPRVPELRAMQDGTGEIGAGEIGAAQIAALQFGFAKVAAPAIFVFPSQECFSVGRAGRLRWLIPGHRGPGREQEHESGPDPDEEAGGWRSPGDRSTMHPRPLDRIALAASQSINLYNRPQTTTFGGEEI